METIASSFTKVLTALPFSSATWFIIGALCFVVWLFYKAHRNPNSSIRWEDLITDSTTGKATPYKMGYLIGVIVSTWLMITLADSNALTFDLFGVYLTFLLGGSGWNSFVGMKSEEKTNARARQMLQAKEKQEDAAMSVRDS